MSPSNPMQKAVDEHLKAKRIATSQQARNRFSPKDTAKLKRDMEVALGKNNFDLYWQQLSSFLMGKISRNELNSALSPLLGMQFGPLHRLHNQLCMSIHYNARPPWLGCTEKSSPTTIVGTKRKADVNGPVVVRSNHGDKRLRADGSVEGHAPVILRKNQDGALVQLVLTPETAPAASQPGFRQHELPFNPMDWANEDQAPSMFFDLGHLPTLEQLKKRISFIARLEGLHGKDPELAPMTAIAPVTTTVSAPKRDMVSESALQLCHAALEIYIKNVLASVIRHVHPSGVQGFGPPVPDQRVPIQDRMPRRGSKRPMLSVAKRVPWPIGLEDVKIALEQNPTFVAHADTETRDRVIEDLATREGLFPIKLH